MASLKYVLLLQRDVPRAAVFYSQGLGLRLKVLTERWAELDAGATTIALKAVEGEACCTVGYSPFLTFKVKELQMTLTQLLQLGGTMDGGVKHLPQGQTAAVRAPDGHMISLVETGT